MNLYVNMHFNEYEPTLGLTLDYAEGDIATLSGSPIQLFFRGPIQAKRFIAELEKVVAHFENNQTEEESPTDEFLDACPDDEVVYDPISGNDVFRETEEEEADRSWEQLRG